MKILLFCIHKVSVFLKVVLESSAKVNRDDELKTTMNIFNRLDDLLDIAFLSLAKV